MFKSWTKLFLAECEVIKFSSTLNIYPIYKNGRSSLIEYAYENKFPIIKNKEISNLEKITVFLRLPKERFVSGVYTFFYLTNNQSIDENILKKIENFDIINRHFVPQYLWLLHLHKYYNGVIDLRPVEELYGLIPNRDGPWTGNTMPWIPIKQKDKDKILSIKHEKYIDIDEKIIKKYMNQSVELKKIIQEFKV